MLTNDLDTQEKDKLRDVWRRVAVVVDGQEMAEGPERARLIYAGATVQVKNGILHHMPARLIYRQKFIYPDGAIRDMVLWQLPKPTKDRPHGLKYRLYYGLADGTGLVRYDNETGKGDHRHYGAREEPYRFINVEALVTDFLADITRIRQGKT